ncbi:hypothetical protein ACHMW6_27870 [Pseudoduganella sp. UC29_106]|uniref:hypothetical protein n=1 Tax=Pseudoduganella sp. UC29_106 TaxID=3374553 RepID=UPI00375756DA
MNNSSNRAGARCAAAPSTASWATGGAASAHRPPQQALAAASRQISGLSPAEILRAGLEDESYWMYRIWN